MNWLEVLGLVKTVAGTLSSVAAAIVSADRAKDAINKWRLRRSSKKSAQRSRRSVDSSSHAAADRRRVLREMPELDA